MGQQLLTCATGQGGLSPVLQVDPEQVQARTPIFRVCLGPIELWKGYICPTGTPAHSKSSRVQRKGRRGEEASHVAVSCHSTVEICNDFLSSSQFYVLVPNHGDNYICASEVPGDGLPGTLGNTGCLEGTHHLMGDIQALPGVLMAPSQSTHTDPSILETS